MDAPRFSYRSKTEHIETRKFDFDIIDERGRVVGYMARVDAIEAYEVDQTKHPYGYLWVQQIDAPGQWFRAYVQTTRDGRPYGPLQYHTYHRTLDEAWAAASKRADAMRKRYTKKYKGAACAAFMGGAMQVGARVRIIGTTFPRHAAMIGRTGTVLRFIKSRGVYDIALDDVATLPDVARFNSGRWEAFPANVEEVRK